MTHKHFKIILVTLLCLCGKEISAKKIEVQSPDGKLKVNIELKDKIYYSIYSGKDLLLDNCSLSMIKHKARDSSEKCNCREPLQYFISENEGKLCH